MSEVPLSALTPHPATSILIADEVNAHGDDICFGDRRVVIKRVLEETKAEDKT